MKSELNGLAQKIPNTAHKIQANTQTSFASRLLKDCLLFYTNRFSLKINKGLISQGGPQTSDLLVWRNTPINWCSDPLPSSFEVGVAALAEGDQLFALSHADLSICGTDFVVINMNILVTQLVYDLILTPFICSETQQGQITYPSLSISGGAWQPEELMEQNEIIQ